MLVEQFDQMIKDRIGRERWSELVTAPTFPNMRFSDKVDLFLDEAFRPGEYSVKHSTMIAYLTVILEDEDAMLFRMKYL